MDKVHTLLKRAYTELLIPNNYRLRLTDKGQQLLIDLRDEIARHAMRHPSDVQDECNELALRDSRKDML